MRPPSNVKRGRFNPAEALGPDFKDEKIVSGAYAAPWSGQNLFENVSESRSRNMAAIRSSRTSIELQFQRAMYGLGARYRLHSRTIPGHPDLSNRREKWVIFVDGCFWHACPKDFQVPKTRRSYWIPKIQMNVTRRKALKRLLAGQGWSVVEVWEHEVRQNPQRAASKAIRRIRSMKARVGRY